MTGYVLLDHKSNHPAEWWWKTECKQIDGEWWVWAHGRQRWEAAEEIQCTK